MFVILERARHGAMQLGGSFIYECSRCNEFSNCFRCCRPTSVERLRELTSTLSLREEATKNAAILLEKTGRLNLSHSILQNSYTKKKIRLGRQTVKKVGEQRLAGIGILPLYRLPLPPSAVPMRSMTDLVKFHYAQCSRTDKDSMRKQAAEKLMNSLPACDLEIWTDGCVGTTTYDKNMSDVWPIYVKWNEKWFSATSMPYKPQHDEYSCTETFKRQHNSAPTHLLFYEDGEIHTVRFERETNQEFAVDENGDKLLCVRPDLHSVGGSGYIIYYTHSGRSIRETKAAGAICTSFTAEVRAAIFAFDRVLQEGPITHSRCRWMVDCQSICTELSVRGKEDTLVTYDLRERIRELTERYDVSLDVVWVSSHCGLPGNEDADALAKSAMKLPLKDHLKIPVDFNDVRAAIRKGRKQPPKDLEELPVNMRQSWTKRKAEVVLNQLYTGCYAMFQPLRHILKLGRGQCAHCQKEDTVAHFFTCPGRISRRREHFQERMGWRTRILRKPFEVLGYLLREEELPYTNMGIIPIRVREELAQTPQIKERMKERIVLICSTTYGGQ